jgi:hypothetical protein
MFIALTTDFGKQSYGVGMMEAVIAEVAPEVRVIHYMHGSRTTTRRALLACSRPCGSSRRQYTSAFVIPV